jgi:hypothetical protein
MKSLQLLAAAALATCASLPATAVTVVPDDQVVQGSQCVGTACVDGESFGFDTIRLKGPVLRIEFVDTSSSAGFPTTDWQLTANDDDASGTSNHFAIEDVTAATAPFTIEAGAPTDSLRVMSDGHVGLGVAVSDPAFVLDVNGSARIDGELTVTGTLTIDTGVKAGIVAAGAFVDGVATVTFATPYAGDYTVLVTALGDAPNRRFKATVVAQDANGFTINAGKKKTTHLIEVHWIAQAVGE